MSLKIRSLTIFNQNLSTFLFHANDIYTSGHKESSFFVHIFIPHKTLKEWFISLYEIFPRNLLGVWIISLLHQENV